MRKIVLSCLAVTFFSALFYFAALWVGLLGIFLMLVIPFIYYRTHEISPRAVITEGRPLLPQIVAGLILCISVMALSLVAVAIIAIYMNIGFLDSLRTYGQSPQNIFMAIFVIGFGEEWFFRGFVFDKLHKDTNNKSVAIFVSSLLFGLVHFNFSLVGDYTVIMLANIVYCIIVGLLLACARAKLIPGRVMQSASLLSVSIAHAAYVIFMPIILQNV